MPSRVHVNSDTGPFVAWFFPAVSASVNQIMYAERDKQSDRQTEIGPFLEWFVPAVSTSVNQIMYVERDSQIDKILDRL